MSWVPHLGWSRFDGPRLQPVVLERMERELVALFLRRLVRYYARTGRVDRARGATSLWRRVRIGHRSDA